MLAEVSDSSPTALRAVRLLAQYTAQPASRVRHLTSASSHASHPPRQPAVLEALTALKADAAVALNPTLLLCAASVAAAEGDYPEALKLCHATPHLELQALAVQLLLQMERGDVAAKVAASMAGADDDAALTQLAGAWVALAAGGAKVTDAAYAFQELGDKYGWTAKLHCGAAACHAAQGAWEEAEKELLEAQACDGKDTEALAGLLVAGLHTGRRGGAKLRAFQTQLRTLAPEHGLLGKQAALEASLDAAIAGLA